MRVGAGAPARCVSSGCAAARIADAAERANRFDRAPCDRTASSERQQHRHRRAILQRAEPLDGERARVRMWIARRASSSAGSARLSSSRCSANATGHQRTRGWPDASSTAAASCVVRLQPDERVERRAGTPPPACRARRRRRPPASARARRLHDLREPARRSASAAAGSPMRPSASAALPCTSGDGSASAVTSGSRALRSPIRPSANAAICRTSGSASASTGAAAARLRRARRGRRPARRAGARAPPYRSAAGQGRMAAAMPAATAAAAARRGAATAAGGAGSRSIR